MDTRTSPRTKEATVELVATWPELYVKQFDELDKKRQATELLELVDKDLPPP